MRYILETISALSLAYYLIIQSIATVETTRKPPWKQIGLLLIYFLISVLTVIKKELGG
jgi:hypothetical protein